MKQGIAHKVHGMVAAAATEPLFPALIKPLLDRGFGAGAQSLASTCATYSGASDTFAVASASPRREPGVRDAPQRTL